MAKKNVKLLVKAKCPKCGVTINHTLVDAKEHTYRCISCGNISKITNK